MTSITTIKIIFLITNLYMVNSYKICPKNSYYKVVDFSSNYDVKTSQYWICKKCAPGYVSDGKSLRCDYCPWFSECDIKSIKYCDKGHYTSHNNGCVPCDITNNEYMNVKNHYLGCHKCINGYIYNNECYNLDFIKDLVM